MCTLFFSETRLTKYIFCVFPSSHHQRRFVSAELEPQQQTLEPFGSSSLIWLADYEEPLPACASYTQVYTAAEREII